MRRLLASFRRLFLRLPQSLRASIAGLPLNGFKGTLLFALWFGMTAGIAEAINGLVRHRIRHLPTGEYVSGELVWLVPVMAATAFLAIALLLGALDRILRARQALIGMAAPLIVGVGVYSLLRALRLGLANYSVILVAVGTAVVILRILTQRPVQAARFIRTSTLLLALALAGWALAVPIWRGARTARAVGPQGEPPPGAPNVILLIWDAARAANLSAYGYHRPTTPTLERLASGGILFEAAFSTAPWSLPSHASMFTGRYPHELTVGYTTPLDDSHPTLGEALTEHGYATAGFMGNLFYGSASYGIARGLAHYDDRPPIGSLTFVHSWWFSRFVAQRIRARNGNYQNMLWRDADHVNGALMRWIRRQDSRPFFAVVNNFDAHHPYAPPPPFNRTFDGVPVPRWKPIEKVTSKERPSLMIGYDACLRYLDYELEQLIAELKDAGKFENTLLIVTADHGEQFGEERSNVLMHGLSLFPSALHVPLVLYYPKKLPQNIRRGETVSIRDIPATVMAVVGIQNHSFPGTSLLRYVDATSREPRTPRLAETTRHRWAQSIRNWPASRGDQFSVIDGKMQYIVDRTGEHLYDISIDWHAQNNLVTSPDASPTVAFYRAMLDSIVPVINGRRRAAAIPSH